MNWNQLIFLIHIKIVCNEEHIVGFLSTLRCREGRFWRSFLDLYTVNVDPSITLDIRDTSAPENQRRNLEQYLAKKEEIWLSPMTKHLYQQKCQKGKNATKFFDYIAIADRLRAVG